MAEVSPTRRPYSLQILWLVFFLLYLPCLWKPPHLDEESYLFIAGEVANSPLRPYDWWRPWQPGGEPTDGSFIYAHPPLFVWSLAAEGLITSSVPGLRLLQFPWVMLWIGACFLLARQFTRQVTLTTVFLGVAPATLLCFHQSLMIDLSAWALAFGGWALVREGLLASGKSWRTLIPGAICLGLAALTKYPTLLVWVPLVLTAPPLKDRQKWGYIAGIGVGIPLLWQMYTWASYGSPHLLYVLIHAGEIARTPLTSRLLGTLAQLGLTVVALPLAWGILPRRLLAASSLLALLGVGLLHWAGGVVSPPGVVGLVWAAVEGSSAGLPPSLLGRLTLVVAWTGGISLLLAMFQRSARRENTDGALAQAWVLTTALVVLGHNFIGGRYLVLPGVLATLWLCRLSERHLGVTRWGRVGGWSAALAGVLTATVAWTDLRWARVYPMLMAQVDGHVQEQTSGQGTFDASGRPSSAGETWWYTGEWGLRYQAEQRGWKNLLLGHPQGGDWVVTSHFSAPGPLPPGLVLAWSLPGPESLLKTQAPTAGIGFYSEVFGLLPWGFAPGPVDIVQVYRVTDLEDSP